MRNITNTFLTGFFTILPLALTLSLIVWLARWVEHVLGGWVSFVLPDSLNLPGVGLVISLALVFLLGLMMKAWLIRRSFRYVESLFIQIPFFNFIYKPMKEVLGMFRSQQKNNTSRVVFVQVPQTPFKMMGLMMRENLNDAHVPVPEDSVAVYFPMSY